MERFEDLQRPSGFHADMGSCAHAVVERCLEEGSMPEDYRGRLVQMVVDRDGNDDAKILGKGARMPADSSRTFEVDGDMIDATTCMVEYVHRRCIELGLIPKDLHDYPTMVGVAELVKRGVVRLEKRVNPLPHRDDTGGTADVVIDAWPELLEVVDYKNGQVYVPIKKNHQLRNYTLGNLMADGVHDYERVRYTVCQPRCREAPPGGISFEECSIKDLVDDFYRELDEAAERVDEARSIAAKTNGDLKRTVEALDKSGYFSTGEDGSHCSYCEIATTCPAAKRKAQELAVMDFDDEPDKLEAPTSANHLAVVAHWLPFLETWVRQAYGNIEHLMMSGHKVDGMKVVRKKSAGRKFKPSITDPVTEDETELTEDEIARVMKDEFGVDKKDLYTDPSLKSGPQIEKLIKGKAEKTRYSRMLLYSPPGGLTIAHEDDPRDAVDVGAQDDFDDDPEA